MDQNDDLKNLFQRLDSRIQELPEPDLGRQFGREIHRFRSPYSKFLEWILNGGFGMVLLFGLVSLSGIFWNGVSFGWMAVPLVIFIMRPFLGEKPLAHPWRMISALLVGSVLCVTMATAVDFAVFCYPDRASLLLLSFFVENSLGALLLPDYLVGIFVLILASVGMGHWAANRYPWLDRKAATKSWRLVASSAVLLSILASVIGLTIKVDRVHPRHERQAALQDPRMADVIYGENLPREGGVVSELLKGQLLITDDKQQWHYIEQLDSHSRRELAGTLSTVLRERDKNITLVDLQFAEKILQSVAEDKSATPDIAYTELWWELLCFCQDYTIGQDVGPLTYELMEKTALPPLIEPKLSNSEAEMWLKTLEARPLRTWRQGELQRLLSIHHFFAKPQQPQSLREQFLSGVEARYMLLRQIYPSYRIDSSDLPIFRRRKTQAKYSEIYTEVRRQLRYDQHRIVLERLIELRQYKAEHGEYPREFSFKGSDYHYEYADDGPMVKRTNWDEKVELVCRLPL